MSDECWCKKLNDHKCVECEAIEKWPKILKKNKIKLMSLGLLLKKEYPNENEKEQMITLSTYLLDRDLGPEDIPAHVLGPV